MPEYVEEQIGKQAQEVQSRGHREMTDLLESSLREHTQPNRQAVQEIALDAVRKVREAYLPDGVVEPPDVYRADYERGMLAAVWQFQKNHRELKPAQLTNQDIVSETHSLHAHFRQLAERYEQAPASQRAEIREEMQPLVNRERELREEYAGRVNPELIQDRVPEQDMGFSR